MFKYGRPNYSGSGARYRAGESGGPGAMKTFTLMILVWVMATTISGPSLAAPVSRVSFDAQCVGGLHEQPQRVFSVFTFCDSALGIHIAVLLQDLDGPFDVQKWGPTNRAWQDHQWASDVTSFAWDPSGHFLFVATSAVYGTGAVYRLDLAKRTYAPVFQIEELDEALVRKESLAIRAETHDAIVESMDAAKHTVELAIRLHGDGQTKIIGRKVLPLGVGP